LDEGSTWQLADSVFANVPIEVTRRAEATRRIEEALQLLTNEKYLSLDLLTDLEPMDTHQPSEMHIELNFARFQDVIYKSTENSTSVYRFPSLHGSGLDAEGLSEEDIPLDQIIAGLYSAAIRAKTLNALENQLCQADLHHLHALGERSQGDFNRVEYKPAEAN
jgi:hypothetical protein